MYPLRSAIRAQASRSSLQRASHASTSFLLATASTRRTAYSAKSTLQLVRGLHASLGVADKKWINQKGNEKASTVVDNDKGKDKDKTGEDITPPVSAADKGNKTDPSEKSLPEVLPEENGVADESESSSRSQVEKNSVNKETTSSKSSSTTSSKEGSASSANSASTPPSAPGSGDGSASKSTNAITKLSIPEIYPQVLALPITRRPLFPGQ